MYIGIDLGTSGVKVVIMDAHGHIIDEATIPLTVSRPKPLWSEQDPQDWWSATCEAMGQLAQRQDLTQVKSIGLSGQMHGATLLDKNAKVLRPAILWNDGRSFEQCQALEKAVTDSRAITGNLMMPGFTAPKLKWIQTHEPDCFAKIDKVLLPKDYLRYRLCGAFASDMSDAAGTLWLDVAKRDWSDKLLSATGLTRKHMPKLYEGTQITGYLNKQAAKQWGMNEIPIVAGGGDNAAGAIGVGLTQPGQAMISLGTSGVYFAVSDGFLANPESALHSFCHALPNTWHTMSVILSAASCLDWVANLIGQPDVSTMMKTVEHHRPFDEQLLFLPYLSGERTPHNNPNAKGVFFGMTHSTTGIQLAQAVLEGVSFAIADGLAAALSTGLTPNEISLIGGGAQSGYWRQLLADILGRKLTYRVSSEVGPALGAARLARIGVEPQTPIATICPIPPLKAQHVPDSARHAVYQEKYTRYRELYIALKNDF